ncbi:hypothetical protein SAMN02910317_01273 [Ruminococcaceae bacterium FB2012]|nr:hypothetical protein SAMN02910317_01273 [Ruminococcaceae bacterium FB2012]
MNDYFDDMDLDSDFLNESYQNELITIFSRYDDEGELISSDDEEKNKALVHRMIAIKRSLRGDD